MAVAYLRCSTDRQDYSVSDQWDALQKWAKQNGYAIIRKYSDDGISGAKAEKRPGFLQMVSAYCKKVLQNTEPQQACCLPGYYLFADAFSGVFLHSDFDVLCNDFSNFIFLKSLYFVCVLVVFFNLLPY